MKVLITGSRHWTSESIIEKALSELPKDTEIIHGGCRGADLIAAGIATNLGLKVKSYIAHWATDGKKAGPLRNQLMLDDNPDIKLVLAFHDDILKGKGTKDMITRVNKVGLEYKIFNNVGECYVWANKR